MGAVDLYRAPGGPSLECRTIRRIEFLPGCRCAHLLINGMVDVEAGPRVLKFGGTSLATPEMARRVAQQVLEAAGSAPTAVVVSARGSATDELLAAASAVSRSPDPRELDQLLVTGETASAALLAMALRDLGARAVSLSGAQAEFSVRGRTGRARLAAVGTDRVTAAFARGEIPVVAGFHGVDATGDVVTLGRGGSDTSAVALAASLGAATCEICTDVAGVFTADPRIVGHARRIPSVGGDVMLAMVLAGAKVLHARCVALAQHCGIDLHVRGSHGSTGRGTDVRTGSEEVNMLEPEAVCTGIAHQSDVVRVLLDLPSGRDGRDVLAGLGKNLVPVDFLTLLNGSRSLEFVVPEDRSDQVIALARGAARIERIATASLIGSGLHERPDCTARALECLDVAGVPVIRAVHSRHRVSAAVPRDFGGRAVLALHDEFELELSRTADLHVAAG